MRFIVLALLLVTSSILCDAKSRPLRQKDNVNSTAKADSKQSDNQQKVLKQFLIVKDLKNKNASEDPLKPAASENAFVVVAKAPQEAGEFEEDHLVPAESQQVSAIATHDLVAAGGGHGKSFSKHSSHKAGHNKAGGSKGGKGFHSSKGHKGGSQGSHGKKGSKGHFSKGGKSSKGHHFSSHHGGGHKSGKKGSKGHKHGKKGHQAKGGKHKGFKNSYSKSESGKSSKFYGDSDFKKYSGDHDHFKSFFSSHKGGGNKGGKHSGGKHHDSFGKGGFFDKGGFHSDEGGHKSSHGKGGHFDTKSSFGKEGGFKSAKGSSHGGGGKGHH